MIRFITVLLGGILISCQSRVEKHEWVGQRSLKGQWVLVCFSDFSTNHSNCRQQSPNSIRLTFSDSGKHGKFQGKTAVNQIFGEYSLLERGQLNFVNIEGTKMNEPDPWGRNFWNSIPHISKYGFSGDTLIFYEKTNISGLKFVVLPPD